MMIPAGGFAFGNFQHSLYSRSYARTSPPHKMNLSEIKNQILETTEPLGGFLPYEIEHLPARTKTLEKYLNELIGFLEGSLFELNQTKKELEEYGRKKRSRD